MSASTKSRNRIVTGIIGLMVGAALVGCQSTTAPVPDSSAADVQKHSLHAAQWVGADGGFLSMGGYSLEIPANAVNANTYIEMRQVAMGSWEVELSPHGTQFNVPVTLSMNVADEPGHTSMKIHWWNPDTEVWEPQVSTEANGVVSAELMHFSRYVIY